MRLIPGKTKVQIEIFKGVSLWDIFIGGIALAMLILVIVSSLPFKFVIAIVIFIIAAMLLLRLDTEPNYVLVLNMLKHFGYIRYFEKMYDDEMLLSIENGTAKEKVLDELSKETKEREKKEAQEKKAEDKKKTAGENGEMSLKEIIKLENEILKSKTATEEEKNAVWLARANRSAAKKEARQNAKRDAIKNKADNKASSFMDNIIAFTGIKDNFIEYGGKYYGAVIEIDPVEFRFFSQHRRDNSIELGVGRVLRSVHSGFAANIVKIERPIIYDKYLAKEYDKLNAIKKSYESGMMSEDELQARVDIENDRIAELKGLCSDKQVLAPFYYIVLFESDKKQLELQTRSAIDSLTKGELTVRRLDTKELAVFLKYTNQLDFNERDIDKYKPEDYAKWAMPQKVQVKYRTVEVNDIVTHNFKVVNYPSWVGDAWLAGVLSIPATKVVVKCSPMDRGKAIRSIDRSLQELRGQYNATGVDSKRIELETHINTLGRLLATLQGEGEELLECNIYVTAYDVQTTKVLKALNELNTMVPEISALKKTVRRTWNESNFRLNDMFFDQMNAFIATQISAYDPESKNGRGIPSNSLAAGYPWIYAHISDEGGFKLGSSGGVPVFIDFFRRDSERVNSNMVIIGKSGSGKSYATKSILSNLASEDAKIFILDPENEYSELAANLHGKVINVANAQFGRLNPFHIITALDDDEEGGNSGGSFATHLQFLEEFYRQILPDIDKDALEYLNNLTERLYTNKGITPETDLSKLRPEDYPIFDDLYDSVLEEFERTDNEYIRSMLRLLVNYIAKFSTGGRNANIWNGPSTVTTDENFTVFNFQAMLSNRNTTIANAQMLLVLKYIDNEIIKNRDYNTKYKLNRKVVVVIDEAHVFIDAKFPVALDFMFQLAKRIRKYNGMQIVITQNIKDFVGSEEIARKSTAIINACQYSFIFALAPNDMHDLVKLYEKAGGINENEQEQIMQAPRGQAFTVMSANSRSTFRVEVPKNMVDMFQDRDFKSRYYTGTEGAAAWEDFIAASREEHSKNLKSNKADNVVSFEDAVTEKKSRIRFEEFSADSEEAKALDTRAKEEAQRKAAEKKAAASKVSFDETDDFDMSDDDLDALIAKRRAEKAAIYMEATPAPAPVVQVVQAPVAPAPAAMTPIDYDAMMSDLREKLVKEVMDELTANGALAAEKAAPAPAPAPTPSPIPASYEEPEDEDFDDDDDLFDDLDDEEDAIPDDEIVAIDTEPEISEEDLEVLEAEEPEESDEDLEDEEEIDFDDEYDLSDEEFDKEVEEYDFSSLFDDEDEGEETEDEDEDEELSSGDSIDIMDLLYESAESSEPAKDKKSKEKEESHITDLSEIAEPGGVADITLEDLADIVTLLRKKKRDMEE